MDYFMLCLSLCSLLTEVRTQTSPSIVTHSTDVSTAPPSDVSTAPQSDVTGQVSGCGVSGEVLSGEGLTGVDCRNGGVCMDSTCRCGQYFTGSDCGQVDLDIPSKDVFETGITFQWPVTLDLTGYYTVFTRVPVTELSALEIQALTDNRTESVTVSGLMPDNKEYLVCVIHADYLGNLTHVNVSALLTGNTLDHTRPDCGLAVTPFDQLGPYTLAAWGIAGAMVILVILLLLVRACCDCRQSARREELVAKALGKLDFLRKPSSKARDTSGLTDGIVA